MRSSPFPLLQRFGWQLGALLLGGSLLLFYPGSARCGAASGPHGAPKAAASEPIAPVKTEAARPLWAELTPAQQIALKPLLANWNSLSESRKRKWLALSKNFEQLPVAEQVKLQSRMTEWVALSVQQRNQARLNFAKAKDIPATEKQAKWQAYQALSPEEKSKLAVKAATPPKGAAPAVKPVPPQQLTVVPTSAQSVKPGQKIATSAGKIDQKTLLPRPEVHATPAALAPVPSASALPVSAPSN
jgi:hypothetical protein